MIKLLNPNNSQIPIVEVYVMEFGSIGVLFLGSPNFKCFNYFKPSSINQQMIINHKGRIYLNSSFKVNLSNLKNIQYQTIDIVVVFDFRTYFLLPYILRQKKLPILMTQPMYEFGKIFSHYFLEQIINQNRFCEEGDFIKQNQAFDRMQQQYDIDLTQFVQIYQAKELSATHLQITSLNPGQIYNFSQLQITPFHDGSSIAQCMWSVKVKSNGNKFTILMNGSFESWKHCKQIQVQRIVDSSYLILGQNLINTQFKQNSNSNTVLSEFILNVQKSLRSGTNVNLLSQSSIHIIDLIEILSYHLGNIIKQIIVLDSNFTNYLKYANSFVQYLNPIRANNIHNDPPQYPFSSLNRLFEKGLLSSGTILSLAMQQKIPTKQILLRHNPAIWIHPTELEYINTCQQNFIQIPDQRVKSFQIQNWIYRIRPKNIIGFQKGTRYYTSQKQMELNVLNYQSFTLTKSIDFTQQYYLKNGIVTESSLKKYRLAPKDWSEKIFKKLSKLGIESKPTASSIETASSKLILKDYTFQITSFSINQCQLLFKALDNI